MSPGRHGKIEIERIKEVLMMKILLNIMVAPFVLALSPSDGSGGVSV